MRIFTSFLHLLPHVDIYTGRNITSKSVISIEHIIPKHFFTNRNDANDVMNLAFTDKYINHIRSDFRYGKLPKNKHRLIHINNNRIDTNTLAYIDKRRRIFYPSELSDKGLIARSIIEMLYKYPYLYCHLDRIVDKTELLSEWIKENPELSEFEKKRNYYLKGLK